MKPEPVLLVADVVANHIQWFGQMRMTPVFEVTLPDAHRIPGALRMGVKILQGKQTIQVPFTKLEFDGKYRRPALGEILSSLQEIAKCVHALLAPGVSANNGIHRVSSH